MIMLSTAISPFFFYQTVENLILNLTFPDSSYFFKVLQVSFNSDFLLVNSLAPPLSLGFAERKYMIAEFAISLCTEKGMLNAAENAVFNLSEFYWCSKRCGL